MHAFSMSRSAGRPERPSAAVSFRRTASYVHSLARKWEAPRVSELEVRVNSRLTTTVARMVAKDGVIELGRATARLDARTRREVICHEAAHFVVWQSHGRSARPHGPEWAALVKLAGFEPKASRVRCGQAKPRPALTKTFRHTCPVCHFSKRAARRVSRWRCPECRAIGLDGSLRIERVSR